MCKFIIKQTNLGYVFEFQVSEKEIIDSFEVYSNRKSCLLDVQSVRRNVSVAKIEDQTKRNFEAITNPKFEVYLDEAGEFRFRLRARNNEIIFVSEGYKAKKSCMKGIYSIVKSAPEASIEK